MNRLATKVAIVTGAGRGLGRAIATRMAEEGASVAIFDTLEREGEALAGELEARSLRTRFWRCDMTAESQVAGAVDQAVAHFGRLDILVNNAGISGVSKPMHEITEAEWDRVQAVNVKGVFFATKHAIPHLKRAGGGSIVNVSSIYGLVGSVSAPPYHASKGAVRLMTKSDAVFYAPDRIRVNSIHPGFIRTAMLEQNLGDAKDEALRAMGDLQPLGCLGDPDDIAWGAVYLASDEAKFVTGSELVIDGGYTAR